MDQWAYKTVDLLNLGQDPGKVLRNGVLGHKKKRFGSNVILGPNRSVVGSGPGNNSIKKFRNVTNPTSSTNLNSVRMNKDGGKKGGTD